MTAEDARPRGPRWRIGTWIRIGRIGGVGLYLDPSLPLVVAFLASVRPFGGDWGRAGLALLALLVFVLVHEGGHAVAARRRGLAVRGIFLHLLPVTYVEQGAPEDEWRVALAGPVANLTLGAVLGAVWVSLGRAETFTWAGLDRDLLGLSVVLNLAMATVNLVPLLPADGGRVVRALVAQHRSVAAARVVTFWLGVLGGLALGLLAVWRGAWPDSLWLALLGVYVVTVARREGAPTLSAR